MGAEEPRPKLIYFNARGRAEVVRLVFAQANVDFEDHRFSAVSQLEEFTKFKQLNKDRVPFDQLPVLEIDGLVLAQSQAILRYVARRCGLIGVNEAEAARADMIVCATEDVRSKFTAAMFPTSDEERANGLQKFAVEVLPKWIRYFENLLRKNTSDWFVGDQPTYADLAMYDLISTIQQALPGAFQHSRLFAHSSKVEELPHVAKWLENRPKSAV